MTESSGFAEYLRSLRPIGSVATESPGSREAVDRVAAAIEVLPDVSVSSVARLIASDSSAIPVLGLAAGVAQEELLNLLRYRVGTTNYAIAARSHAAAVASLLAEVGALERIAVDRERAWTYADVLFERLASRSRAGRAINRGRVLENDVEAVVTSLGLSYAMRTRFRGRGDRDAPCDLAIPEGGARAQIVCAIKGFDSTGSKLTDAVREIAEMHEVRTPGQYVFAVVDGIGWLRRQADLR